MRMTKPDNFERLGVVFVVSVYPFFTAYGAGLTRKTTAENFLPNGPMSRNLVLIGRSPNSHLGCNFCPVIHG
jgi:hypothetical protein